MGKENIRCLEKVAAGKVRFERDLMTALMEARPVRISPRERQLVDLATRGLSNKQMASELSISEGTVKVYFSKLFRKAGVSDRFELVLLGLRNLRLDGLLSAQRNHRSILLRSGIPKRLSVA